MNVLYCGDQNMRDGLLISILSLTKNVKECLKIFVLTVEVEYEGKCYLPICDSDIAFLDELVRTVHADSFVKKMNITQLFHMELPSSNMGTRFTPCCMLRLFADRILELPDRILYLDTDVICRKGFEEFYYQNMTEIPLAGVLDYYGSWFFRRKLWKRDYLNSGVLLMNLAFLRETGLLSACRKYCAEKKMFMPDQSALNKLAKEKKVCARKYNEQRRLRQDTVFQHFTTSFRLFPYFHTVTVKPWQVEQVHELLKLHEYDDLLEEYQQLKKQMDSKKASPEFFE